MPIIDDALRRGPLTCGPSDSGSSAAALERPPISAKIRRPNHGSLARYWGGFDRVANRWGCPQLNLAPMGTSPPSDYATIRPEPGGLRRSERRARHSGPFRSPRKRYPGSMRRRVRRRSPGHNIKHDIAHPRTIRTHALHFRQSCHQGSLGGGRQRICRCPDLR
jgi:hypothetical protein